MDIKEPTSSTGGLEDGSSPVPEESTPVAPPPQTPPSPQNYYPPAGNYPPPPAGQGYFPYGYPPRRSNNSLPFILIGIAAVFLVSLLIVLTTSSLNSLPQISTPQIAVTQPAESTKVVEATKLVEPTKVVVKTKAPTPSQKSTLEVWIPEATSQTMLERISAYDRDNTNIEINVQTMSYDSYDEMLVTAAAAGTFPDVALVYNSNLPELYGALAPLDENTDFNPSAQEISKYKGITYGVPLSTQGVVMYYNKTAVSIPPATTDELLDMAKQGVSIGIININYWLIGFFTAFGGQIMDNDGACAMNSPEMENALLYLQELYQAGVRFDADLTTMQSDFQNGNLDILVDGTWMLSSFYGSLGDELGVAPIPAEAFPAAGLNEALLVVISNYSSNKDISYDLALFLASPEIQQIDGDNLEQVPTRQVTLSVDIMQQAYLALQNRYTVPDETYLTGFWSSFNNLWTDIVVNQQPLSGQLESACQAMDSANGR